MADTLAAEETFCCVFCTRSKQDEKECILYSVERAKRQHGEACQTQAHVDACQHPSAPFMLLIWSSLFSFCFSSSFHVPPHLPFFLLGLSPGRGAAGECGRAHGGGRGLLHGDSCHGLARRLHHLQRLQVQYCTRQTSTVLYSTVRRSTVYCSGSRHSTIQYSTVLEHLMVTNGGWYSYSWSFALASH